MKKRRRRRRTEWTLNDIVFTYLFSGVVAAAAAPPTRGHLGPQWNFTSCFDPEGGH